jgi:hypothetical protein
MLLKKWPCECKTGGSSDIYEGDVGDNTYIGGSGLTPARAEKTEHQHRRTGGQELRVITHRNGALGEHRHGQKFHWVTGFAGVQELQVITPCNGASGELRNATTSTKAERTYQAL